MSFTLIDKLIKEEFPARDAQRVTETSRKEMADAFKAQHAAAVVDAVTHAIKECAMKGEGHYQNTYLDLGEKDKAILYFACDYMKCLGYKVCVEEAVSSNAITVTFRWHNG